PDQLPGCAFWKRKQRRSRAAALPAARVLRLSSPDQTQEGAASAVPFLCPSPSIKSRTIARVGKCAALGDVSEKRLVMQAHACIGWILTRIELRNPFPVWPSRPLPLQFP